MKRIKKLMDDFANEKYGFGSFSNDKKKSFRGFKQETSHRLEDHIDYISRKLNNHDDVDILIIGDCNAQNLGFFDDLRDDCYYFDERYHQHFKERSKGLKVFNAGLVSADFEMMNKIVSNIKPSTRIHSVFVPSFIGILRPCLGKSDFLYDSDLGAQMCQFVSNLKSLKCKQIVVATGCLDSFNDAEKEEFLNKLKDFDIDWIVEQVQFDELKVVNNSFLIEEFFIMRNKGV